MTTSDRDAEIEAWKERFAAINSYVDEHGGWIVSPPADRAMRLQALPGSDLPAQLRELGYIIERTGETERVHALRIEIVETYDLRIPTPKLAIDPATIFDGNTRELSADYRRAVAAALPVDICPTEQFWRELLLAVEGYFALAERRRRRPPKCELERWKHITALVDELGKELREVRRQARWSTIDPLWSNEALSALWLVKDRAEAHVAGYQQINAGSRGRNLHHKFLYGAVLDLWCGGLGQKLRYSKSEKTATRKATPSGPLIRFVAACVDPILGDDALTPRGIAAAVDREKKIRGAAYPLSEPKK